MTQSIHFTVLQKVLSEVQALQFVHGFDLLLAFHTCCVESLVLVFNACNFFLDFLLPLVVLLLLTLVVLLFEFADVVQLGLFFYFKQSLLNCLCQQNIQDRLYLSVIIEQIVVTNLSILIDTSLFGDILRSRRLRQENVCLCTFIINIRLVFALLSQKVSEINVNTCWGTRSQIIWRSLVLRLFEFNELLLDHLYLLSFTFNLNSLLLFLSRCRCTL